MKRILMFIVGLLCISMISLAQQAVPFQTALDTAMADINARLGTNYVVNGGQVAFEYNEERVTGDNLGCPNVAATNQNSYLQMTTRFDVNLDGVFEWEHRFAYEADGTLKMILCVEPGADIIQTLIATTPLAPVTTLTPTATITPDGTPLAPIFGRDGPRILPAMVCGGLKTRLVNGSTGRVIPGGAENNLRQSSDFTSAKIGFLAAGAVFVVMDGPFCNGDIAWYLVGDGITPVGWTAEGAEGDYFVEPVLTNAQPVSADVAGQLLLYGGTFAFPVQAISANWPGGLLVSTDHSLQLWRTIAGFTPLETLQWDVATEFEAPHQWIFVDNTGRQWAADVSGGQLTLLSPNNDSFAPFTVANGGALPVVVVDNESNAAAIVGSDPNTVELVQLGINTAQTQVLLSLPQPSAVRDVAFGANGMRLYVLTDNQISVYAFVMGEGWAAQAQQVINVDLAQGKLAVDEGGARVAVTGTSAAGVSGIRVFNNLNTETVGDETSVNFDAPQGVLLSRPSFSADGSLVAAHASNNMVALMNTATGAVSNLTVSGGTSTTTSDSVAFSRDGLALFVVTDGSVQSYAVALPVQP